MPSTALLKALGLNTSPNPLNIPDGSLTEASNVIIKRDNIIESRRGFKLYGSTGFGVSSDIAKQLLDYKDRILCHYGSKLAFDDGNGVFTNFSGTYNSPTSGLRIKAIEANANYYFTSDTGVKKISAKTGSDLSSASNYITQAGGIKSVDINSTLNIVVGRQNSFFTQDSAVAYRVVWGIKDVNNNLILGSPSARSEIYNSLLQLLLRDFVNVLGALDDVNQAGSIITDGNYVNTLKLSSTSTALQLHSNLVSLTTKLDSDLKYADQATPASYPLQISTASVTANVVTINFSVGNPTNYFAIGSNIEVSGFSDSAAASLNGTYAISALTSTSLSFNKTSTAGACTITGTAYIKSNEFRNITQPAAPSILATNSQLVSIQNYLGSILLVLQSLPNATVSSSLMSSYLAPLALTKTATVTLDITIPNNVTNNHFFQIYRSLVTPATGVAVLASDVTPNDELKLVYEAFPTSAQLAAKKISVEDITLDEFAGANLYTNPTTGEGIAQANDLPPFCKDINIFKNTVFYANTKTLHRKSISLLGISNMISDYNLGTTPKIVISNGTTTNTYTFALGVNEVTNVACVADVANSLNGKYFNINTAQDKIKYYVWFKTSGGSVSDPAIPGRTGIRVNITTGDSASTVATKIRDVLSRYNIDYTVSASGINVIVTNTTNGYTTDAVDGNTGFTISVTTQGLGENSSTKQVLLSSNVSPAQAVDETARSLVRVINQNNSEIVYAYYVSGAQDIPGQIILEARTLNDTPFYILGNNSNTGLSFSPNISPTNTITNISIAYPTIVTSTAHGLSTGDSVVIINSNSTPSLDGLYPITRIDADHFSIPVNVTVGGSAGSFVKASNGVFSANEDRPNRIYYSKLQQPEAVPIVNYLDVGPQDSEIVRIYPLRDSLFVFKKEGLYRISGEIAPFTLSLFDSTCHILAPDSLSVANNQLYLWAGEGITLVSEAGVAVISRAIDVDILKLSSNNYPNFSTATWGVGYESDNAYYVFTIKDVADTSAKICYRYSNITNTWTTLDKANTCGIVTKLDDRLYLGASDTNYIEQERKTFTRLDYADREISTSLIGANFLGGKMGLTSVSQFSIGDVVTQVQYVTVYLFNMLLKKLDIDTPLTDRNYYSLLQAKAGDTLNLKLDSLINKVANDAGRLASNGATPAATYTALTPSPTDFTALQATYNAFIGILNSDAAVSFSNYKTVTDSTTQEAVITDVNYSLKTITLNLTLDFVVGPLTIYKAIKTAFTYAPNTMGDPLNLKHIREATMIFSNKAFTNATISFASDLKPAFIDVPFNGDGNGVFGNDTFGNNYFGGTSNSAPLRTYIPRDCQRCRFIVIRFTHSVAREQFAVYGTTLTGENSQSSRAYR